ncbi:MAG: MarR family transcriptional regulator [Actinomycetota bacterium]|nr:MarR family transcriptional regulator [Actinomycetota bacterium]
MSEEREELELRAWRGFLRAHGLVMRTLDSELNAERTLGLSSYEVLLMLAWAPGRALRMSELADRVLLSRSGTTRLVDGLVAKGLVERRRCPSDARGYLAVLTEEGLGRLRDAAPVHLRGVREHFSGPLSKTQLEAVAEAMEAIIQSRPLLEVGQRSSRT